MTVIHGPPKSPSNRARNLVAGLNAHHVSMPQIDQLVRYLTGNPDLIDPIQKLAQEVRLAFPTQAAQVVLTLYRDPEIPDQYLAMYVRPRDYTDDTVGQIDSVWERCSASFSGPTRFLLTTDFQPPGPEHAI